MSDDTRIDTLSDTSSFPSGVNVKDLLYEAYRWIGDPDGVYGCGAGRQADAMSRYGLIMLFFSVGLGKWSTDYYNKQIVQDCVFEVA